MDILVLTGYDDNMQELGDICLPSKRAYAERHGYAFECVREYPKDVHPSWHKLQLLRDRIDKYDAIFWLDADTIVTRGSIKIIPAPQGNPVLSASADWCSDTDGPDEMPSMGNFILCNTDETQQWIDLAMQQVQFKNRPMWEQQAVQKCIKENHWFRNRVFIQPRRLFNAVHTTCTPHGKPPGAPWQPGDFLIHLTGVENRIELAKEFAALAGC
jgi:hypothetical protein